MLNFQKLLSNTSNSLSNLSTWIKIAAFIFFGSAVLLALLTSFAPEQVEEFFNNYFEEIESIGEQVFSADPFEGVLILFWNNLMAAIVMMIMGIIFTLPTFAGLFVNGGALGVLAVMLSNQGENPLTFYALGILPHGLFEIPAILIAGAVGLKIGWELVFSPQGIKRGQRLKNNFSLGVNLLPTIVLLLFLAAIIEIYITPQLLGISTTL